MLDQPITSIFNQLALSGLSTVDGRLEATKKRLGIQAKVPLYLNKETLLLPLMGIRSHQSLFVNYFSISSFRKDMGGAVVISFFGCHDLRFKSYHIYVELYRKSLQLLESMENGFC